MKITDILNKSCIRIPLQATESIQAIEELVNVLHEQGKIDDRDEVLKAIITREQTRSTGIGEGLAVPHGKCHGCKEPAIAIGKPSVPIDFGGKDGRPCELIFLLASPVDKMGPHIQALARISRTWLAPEFRDAAAHSDTPDELYNAILRQET